jgi:hypothetical protein
VILLLRRGWRNLGARRHIGVVWDISTFWPRAYHPLAPPSYAERAVPELQLRLRRLHDSGERVVIAAHSQGTIIAAAALVQSHARKADDLVALVTFGSPLTTLYGWAFPAYFNQEVLHQLTPLGGTEVTRLYAWRNTYSPTDYIGRDIATGQPAEPVKRKATRPRDPVVHLRPTAAAARPALRLLDRRESMGTRRRLRIAARQRPAGFRPGHGSRPQRHGFVGGPSRCRSGPARLAVAHRPTRQGRSADCAPAGSRNKQSAESLFQPPPRPVGHAARHPST